MAGTVTKRPTGEKHGSGYVRTIHYSSLEALRAPCSLQSWHATRHSRAMMSRRPTSSERNWGRQEGMHNSAAQCNPTTYNADDTFSMITHGSNAMGYGEVMKLVRDPREMLAEVDLCRLGLRLLPRHCDRHGRYLTCRSMVARQGETKSTYYVVRCSLNTPRR